jgi:tetraacyldisaccharide 4'-kinase
MRAPTFWWRAEHSLLAQILQPLALIYGASVGRRMGRAGIQASRPVVCVGNFTAGGAGKTPTAWALAALLSAAGEKPAFLSRGYGGRLPGPVRVEPGLHTSVDVGDEPLLLARSAPTIVSRDRPAGVALAVEAGASVIVMDDGLQNPSLAKDLSVAVVDGTTGIGNGLSLPAGPLRAPLQAQWPRVDAVLVIGRGEPGERIAQDATSRGKAVLRASLAPDPSAAARLHGQRVLAFAGIGRPEKLFDSLRACGAILVEQRSFGDHHPYTAAEVARLAAEAGAKSLRLVTTDKDRVRLEGLGVPLSGFDTLPVHLVFEDEERVRGLLIAALARRRGSL